MKLNKNLLLLFSIILFLAYGCIRNVDANHTLPSIKTLITTFITSTTAEGGGTVTSDGGTTVTSRGVCWSVNHNPDLRNSYTTDGTGEGTFSSQISGLTQNTTYYIKAYATNSLGTAYGEELSFKTTTIPGLPSVTTDTISQITDTSAKSGGYSISDGGSQITAKGLCWSTTLHPTISDSHTNDGTGTAGFQSVISNLAPSSTYYVRAYVINGVGVNYGNEYSFTTMAPAPDVYVAGWDSTSTGNPRAIIWKNNVPIILGDNNSYSHANSVFVSGSDIYAAGNMGNSFISLKATVWKNGVPTTLSNYGGIANSVFVSGPDVYVAGNESDTLATIWKNGVPTTLGHNRSSANSVFVMGSDVYVAGYEYYYLTYSGQRYEYTNATIWKNGVPTILVNFHGVANSVFVSGSDVYVAGNAGDTTRIWKNGISTNLSDYWGRANSVFISGSDVYVAGYRHSVNGATIWKNGVPSTLPGSGSYNDAFSVSISNSNIYAVGTNGDHATVWKNSISWQLTTPTSFYTTAKSIFIK